MVIPAVFALGYSYDIDAEGGTLKEAGVTVDAGTVFVQLMV